MPESGRSGAAGNSPSGLIVAGTTSGSGKTVTTCGLIGALRRIGYDVAPAKCGPDYIDPAFLAAAAGRPAINLDPWAMATGRIANLIAGHAAQGRLLVIEGVMGLFDGAEGGKGSTADLARKTGLPVLLVVPAAGTAQSAAATAEGFASAAGSMGISIIGVLVTHIASPRHAGLVREGFEHATVPLLGLLPRQPDLKLQSRHLGLVQAREHTAIGEIMDAAADMLATHVDIAALAGRAGPATANSSAEPRSLSPPGQRIAVADDRAFGFLYAHWLQDFRRAGAEVRLFSPLADEPPGETADAILLPGGYPEMCGPDLAAASAFLSGLSRAADQGIPVYGECGGYMALGQAIIDADGLSHRMAGLLPLVSDFSAPKLNLGYRDLRADGRFFWPGPLRGHEFHYAAGRQVGEADPLFAAHTTDGRDLGSMGMRRGSVAGSFAHIIDRAG